MQARRLEESQGKMGLSGYLDGGGRRGAGTVQIAGGPKVPRPGNLSLGLSENSTAPGQPPVMSLQPCARGHQIATADRLRSSQPLEELAIQEDAFPRGSGRT